MQQSFGSLVRAYRRDAGLTQEELAERAGLSIRAIGNLERDTEHTPRKDTVQLLATALELSGDRREELLRIARIGRARQAPAQASPISGFLGLKGASQGGTP